METKKLGILLVWNLLIVEKEWREARESGSGAGEEGEGGFFDAKGESPLSAPLGDVADVGVEK